MIEAAALWRPAGLPGVEAMRASYRAQVFSPHSHAEFLFGVIEAGAHSVWTRGVRYLATAGVVATMHPDQTHHGGAGDEHGWRQRMVYVPEPVVTEILADAADRESRAAPSFAESFRPDADLARRFAAAHDALTDPDPMTRRAALDGLVLAVSSRHGGARPARPSRADPEIDRARDYLRAHRSEPITLETLARVAGLRRRALIERFKRRHGMPPHRYLVQLRVWAAAAMLAEGASPAQAAIDAGFADQSHLTRHFRAVAGLTPARYGRTPAHFPSI